LVSVIDFWLVLPRTVSSNVCVQVVADRMPSGRGEPRPTSATTSGLPLAA